MRRPAVAGMFYPSDRAGLDRALDSCFADSRVPQPSDRTGVTDRPPRALIVPHAGFVYSGPVAASAYRLLDGWADRIDRVVLIGPSHRVALEGVAVSSADVFETPLGGVVVDDDLRRRVIDLPGVSLSDAPHAYEHSLEVQVPFLQRVLGRFSLLPLAVGRADRVAVAAVFDAVWDLVGSLVVVSTDLSHYHPYVEASALDRRTSDAIVRADADAIDDRAACGAYGLRPLLDVAAVRGARVRLIDLRNSGDTAGDRHRVVGYGAFAVS